MTFDAEEVRARTGWRVLWGARVESTNDEAAALARAGRLRTVVVADVQTAGRGRGGARFESPAGGLYASALVAARVEHLPAWVTAAAGLALVEAVEDAAGVAALLKWPNDVWVEGRKAAGVLVEAASPGDGGALVPVVVGVGVNLRAVPPGLPAHVAARTTALDAHAKAPVRREDLLASFLARLDTHLDALRSPEGAASVESSYRGRLALLGENVRCLHARTPVEGVLLDVRLDRGVCLESPAGVRTWLPAAHVSELRPR